MLTGSWGDGDENLAVGGAPDVRDPADSIELSDALASLMAGDAYIAVHTAAFSLPDSAELRGQIQVVPEPGTAGLLLLGLGVFARSRRSRPR